MDFSQRFISLALPGAIAGLALTTLATWGAPGAIARDVEDFPVVPQGIRFGEVANEFEEQFFSHDRNYYRNRSFAGQLKRIFGPFPENSMYQDANDVHKLYLQTFYKQMNSGPVLRTIDLENPFQFSLRTLPPPVVAQPIQVVEPPMIVAPPVAPAVPMAPPKPVPALW